VRHLVRVTSERRGGAMLVVMTSGSDDRTRTWRSFVVTAATVLIGIITLIDAWEELRSRHRRGMRTVAGWKEDAERREQRQLHETEVALLASELTPIARKGERRS